MYPEWMPASALRAQFDAACRCMTEDDIYRLNIRAGEVGSLSRRSAPLQPVLVNEQGVLVDGLATLLCGIQQAASIPVHFMRKSCHAETPLGAEA